MTLFSKTFLLACTSIIAISCITEAYAANPAEAATARPRTTNYISPDCTGTVQSFHALLQANPTQTSFPYKELTPALTPGMISFAQQAQEIETPENPRIQKAAIATYKALTNPKPATSRNAADRLVKRCVKGVNGLRVSTSAVTVSSLTDLNGAFEGLGLPAIGDISTRGPSSGGIGSGGIPGPTDMGGQLPIGAGSTSGSDITPTAAGGTTPTIAEETPGMTGGEVDVGTVAGVDPGSTLATSGSDTSLVTTTPSSSCSAATAMACQSSTYYGSAALKCNCGQLSSLTATVSLISSTVLPGSKGGTSTSSSTPVCKDLYLQPEVTAGTITGITACLTDSCLSTRPSLNAGTYVSNAGITVYTSTTGGNLTAKWCMGQTVLNTGL